MLNSPKSALRDRKDERGQTIVLVAISMFALIAMAAIAIDVTTLYVARTEAQQAVDAAALAGAKAFVSSGFTSGYVDLTTGETLATNQARAVGQRLKVAGQTLQSSEFTITFPQTTQENPVISVAVAHTGVPTFFARIWGIRSTNVGATAAAEAYNPSGQNAPIQLNAIKPFLMPNCPPTDLTGTNPNCATPFYINPTDGSIANSGTFIGSKMSLVLPSQPGSLTSPPQPPLSGGQSYFYPIDIPIDPPTPLCPASSRPSCSAVGNGIYFDNIACSNPTQLSCGQIVGGTTTIPVDTRLSQGGSNWGQLQQRVDQGTQCLIHATSSGLNSGEDVFISPAPTGQRLLISPGSNNPDPSLAGSTYISRSDSIVTIPIFNGTNLCLNATPSSPVCSYTAPIDGFLQLGITQDAGSGTIEAYILNASGCNPSSSGPTVTGGSIASVPVRLVHQ